MYSEQNKAAEYFDYYLIINLGGEVDCDVHFNIESDLEDDPNWTVSKFELFFLGENVTRMVSAEAVEEKIYEQRLTINDQIRGEIE